MPEEKSYFMRAKVVQFEDKAAQLVFPDGQTINWPIKNLPDDIKEGDETRLVFSSAASEVEEREKIAKEILNQLLKA
ncbi:MAG: hypothetical protein WC528_00025 [Patescibacteria group bacterium]